MPNNKESIDSRGPALCNELVYVYIHSFMYTALKTNKVLTPFLSK